MRPEVEDAIADMTQEERGALIKRVQGYDWTAERKAQVITYILLLGVIGREFPKNGQRPKDN